MIRKTLPFALLLFAHVLFAQSDPTSRSWNQPVAPFRIAPNLYYVGANEITSYLITTPKGHIVLDGGFAETAPQILANIRTLGFEPRDVRILIGSHAHVDHAGGLAELKRATGAKFHASRFDLPLYARGGLDDPSFANRLPYPPVYADRIVDDGDRITLGGITLVAHLTPGHTRGCMTWSMKTGGKNVVFVGSPSVPSNYRLTDEMIREYRAQFVTLKKLACDIFLASHGNFFDLEAKRAGKKSFVDPEGYRAFVAAMEQRFEARVTAVTNAGNDGSRSARSAK